MSGEIFTKATCSCVSVSGMTVLSLMFTLHRWQPLHQQIVSFVVETEQTFTDSFIKPAGKEVRHVRFLKVHKAGSCTVQNIFFRFGIKRNLTFVFPRNGHYFLRRDDIMPVKGNGHYDILATHSVFKEELFTVTPNDSINVAIIRDPLDRMISAAYYYRDIWKVPYLTRVPRDNFITNLANHPETYDTPYFSWTKNSMGKDFGFPAYGKNSAAINTRIEYLDKRIKLVMTTERFDESLVLLKRMLNWGLNDILYCPTNTHEHQPVTNISDEARAKFRETCFLDYKIYDTFKAKLDQLIASEGQDFQHEVAQFKSILTQTGAYCHNTTRQALGQSLRVLESRWNPEFQVSTRDCELMTMKVEPFFELMRKRHAEMNKPT